jgi:hypothetical protein
MKPAVMTRFAFRSEGETGVAPRAVSAGATHHRRNWPSLGPRRRRRGADRRGRLHRRLVASPEPRAARRAGQRAAGSGDRARGRLFARDRLRRRALVDARLTRRSVACLRRGADPPRAGGPLRLAALTRDLLGSESVAHGCRQSSRRVSVMSCRRSGRAQGGGAPDPPATTTAGRTAPSRSRPGLCGGALVSTMAVMGERRLLRRI